MRFSPFESCAISGENITRKPAVLQVFAAELSQLIIDLEVIASRYKGIVENSGRTHPKVGGGVGGPPMTPH